MKRSFIPLFSCYALDTFSFAQHINIASVAPDGVFIAGGETFGNPEDYPMSNDNGFTKPKGFTSRHTFLNGIYRNWKGLLTDKNLFDIQTNLVSNYANIQFADDAINQIKEITIFNTVGQVKQNILVNHTNTIQINTTNFANGLYFISVSTSERKLTKEFMIAK